MTDISLIKKVAETNGLNVQKFINICSSPEIKYITDIVYNNSKDK